MKLTNQSHNKKPFKFDSKKFAKVITLISVCALVFAVFAFPASAATINNQMTTDTLVGGIIEFIVKVAFYIGIVIAGSGIFMFIMAYKDDNAESQSRGARMAVVGALLIGIRPLLVLTGLIKN